MSIIATLKLKEIINMQIISFRDKSWIYYIFNINLAFTYKLKIMLFFDKKNWLKIGQITLTP